MTMYDSDTHIILVFIIKITQRLLLCRFPLCVTKGLASVYPRPGPLVQPWMIQSGKQEAGNEKAAAWGWGEKGRGDVEVRLCVPCGPG